MKSTTLTVTAVSVGVGAGTIAVCWFISCLLKRWRLRRPPAPDSWQRLGTLKEISMYPFKSGAPMHPVEVYCDTNGLTWGRLRDRCLLLVNDDDKVVCAGWHPHMLSVQTELVSEGVVRLSAPNLQPLTLDLNELAGTGKPVTSGRLKKRHPLPLVECRPEHHSWCSQAVLQQECGLRLHLELDGERLKNFWGSKLDEFQPLMVLHEKSVRDLNTRLSAKNQVHHSQFRGNLLLETLPEVPPYDEDRWLWLKIGDEAQRQILLRFNAECMRCILVNLDVRSCARNADFEPLKTLKKYRARENPREPAMGVYFDICGTGATLRQGDAVYVQYKDS